MKTYIVYGRMGCGKTSNAAKIAAHLGSHVISDDFYTGQHLITGGLHLTNDDRFYLHDADKGSTTLKSVSGQPIKAIVLQYDYVIAQIRRKEQMEGTR